MVVTALTFFALYIPIVIEKQINGTSTFNKSPEISTIVASQEYYIIIFINPWLYLWLNKDFGEANRAMLDRVRCAHN